MFPPLIACFSNWRFPRFHERQLYDAPCNAYRPFPQMTPCDEKNLSPVKIWLNASMSIAKSETIFCMSI